MTQQPFSRPGAIDLSALKRPAAQVSSQFPAAPPTGTLTISGESAYSLNLNEQNFQSVLESSRSAPVLLVFWSPTRLPESAQLAADITTLADEFGGKFLAGLVNIDEAPAIAQAMQIPSIPLVVVIVEGRPVPLLQDVVPMEELRAALTQVFQQFALQGVTGRHQPLTAAHSDEDDEWVDPRYAPAQDALASGDIASAVAEYQRLVDSNPADAEAAAGLAMAKLLLRTMDVDLNAARADAAANPDDVAKQTLVADLDLLGGHVEDAFARLVELVRRTTGDERNQAREHLLGLFGAVGNDDARVIRARQNLTSALF